MNTPDDREQEPLMDVFTVKVPRARTELVEATTPEAAALFAADRSYLGNPIVMTLYHAVEVIHPNEHRHFPLRGLDVFGYLQARHDTRHCRFIRMCVVCNTRRLTANEDRCPVCDVRHRVEHREPRDCKLHDSALTDVTAWEVYIHETTPGGFAVRWAWTDGRNVEEGVTTNTYTIEQATAYFFTKVNRYKTGVNF